MSEIEKERPKIIKVELRASVGMSVQTSDGDWIKTDMGLNTHVGPGYPSDEMAVDILTTMTRQAYEGNVDQIELIVAKGHVAVEGIGGR